MDRYRLIASIIFLFIYLLARYPVQTIFITIIIVIAYFILREAGTSTIIERTSREDRRRAALSAASLYLSPYTDIWYNLKLSNKYCSLRLGSHSRLITARDSKNPDRYFVVKASNSHTYEDLWNMLCYRFGYNTTFDELAELMQRLDARIKLSENQDLHKEASNSNELSNNETQKDENEILTKENKELLDVNNASEIELTALPGVSIVMAKKIIKRREEIGGFKSVNDVCMFLNLKPHLQTQLEKLICVKKMKGSLKINKYNERSVDI